MVNIMAFSLQNQEIQFHCPFCNSKITLKIRDLNSAKTCPKCKGKINFNDDGFKQSVKKAEKELKDFEKQLKNFGK